MGAEIGRRRDFKTTVFKKCIEHGKGGCGLHDRYGARDDTGVVPPFDRKRHVCPIGQAYALLLLGDGRSGFECDSKDNRRAGGDSAEGAVVGVVGAEVPPA